MTGITFISSSEALTLRLLKTDEYNTKIFSAFSTTLTVHLE
jgi:hypothetical protein